MPSPDENTQMMIGSRVSLLSVVSGLSMIEPYEPVGALLEEVRMALHQGSGMTHAQFARGMAWAQRWGSIDERLRRLYEDALAGGVGAAMRRSVEVAIWKILEGGSEPTGMTYAILREGWVEMFGYPPPIEMIPRIDMPRRKQ